MVMGTSRKAKRASVQAASRRVAGLGGEICDFLNTLPGRPLPFILLLLVAALQGHFVPLLWSYSPTQPLLQGLLHPRPPPQQPPLQQGELQRTLQGQELESLPEEDRRRTTELPDLPTETDSPAAPILAHPAPAGDEESSSSRDESSSLASTSARGGSSGVEHSASLASSSDDRNEEPESSHDKLTPYVTFHRINVGATPACRGIYPADLIKNINRKPIKGLAGLDEPGRRALVFMPRYGLGNSLRGFTSAYVFARLTGRTLVRFHGAEHTKVYDTLCAAFRCGFDSIHWDNQTGPMAIYRGLDALNPFPMYKTSAGVRNSIHEDVPVMLSRSPSHFDGFWRNTPGIMQCVYSSFACASVWCVHSRAIHGLLKGPTPALKAIVRTILRKHVGPAAAGGTPRDVPAAEDKDAAGRPKPLKGVASMFDVALHMRTRAAAIESLEGGNEELSRVGCYDKPGAPKTHQFLKACLWNCISSILSELEKSRRAFWEAKRKAGASVGPAPRLSILLATDNEALRPEFVNRLAPLGDVYFSQGGIVHLSKSAGSDAERMPTMAEFYLMAKSHTIIEAGSYVSTFAYFAALFGNGTLASIDWYRGGGCGLKLSHQGEIARHVPRPNS